MVGGHTFVQGQDCQTQNQDLRFLSRRHNPEADGLDALSCPWRSRRAYVLPLLALIFPLLRRIRRESMVVVLVVHFWPSDRGSSSAGQVCTGAMGVYPGAQSPVALKEFSSSVVNTLLNVRK